MLFRVLVEMLADAPALPLPSSMSISLELLPTPLVAGAFPVRLPIPNKHYFHHVYLANRFITARLHPVFVRSEVKRIQPDLTPPHSPYIKPNIFHSY